MTGWVSHFGLSNDPFIEDPHQSRFFYGASYGLASLRLEQAIEQRRGIILVTGAAGCGKSVLAQCVLRQVPAYASATVSAARSAPATVIDALLRGRGRAVSLTSAIRKRAALLEMVAEARRQQRPIVCIVDDAHRASVPQLKELFTALNIAPDIQTVLQVVLVGRPALRRRLRARSLAALRTRVTTHVRIDPLAPADVTDFLNDRLEGAGAEAPASILPPAAVAAVTRHSRGRIARCAAITRSALERAADSGAAAVSSDVVEQVAATYDRLGEAEESVLAGGWRRALDVTRLDVRTTALALLAGLALVVAAARIGDVTTRSHDDGRTAAIGAAAPAAESLAAVADDGEPRASTVAIAEQAASMERDASVAQSSRAPERAASMQASDASMVAAPAADDLAGVPPEAPPTPVLYAAAAFGGVGPIAFDHGGITLAQRGDDTQPSTLRRKFLDGSKYEVKIAPPPRPEAAAAAATAVQAAADDGATPSEDGDDSSASAGPAPGSPSPAPRPVTGSDSSASLPRPAGAGVPDADAPRPSGGYGTASVTGPTVALQVGAFRELRSAIELRTKLSASFEDVYISTVESGGVPLYRVRVGRLPSAEQTPDLRARLQAAGYPSFRVTETETR